MGQSLTCPFDVVQTRLQSSNLTMSKINMPSVLRRKPGSPATPACSATTTPIAKPSLNPTSAGKMKSIAMNRQTIASTVITSRHFSTPIDSHSSKFGLHVFSYMRQMVQREGIGSLFKGLTPNLMGTAPTRAIYFLTYSQTKRIATESKRFKYDSYIHMLSAWAASWTTSTVTNPIWFLKTRLQLDTNAKGEKQNVFNIVRATYRNEGIRGFYRGMTASYFGALETMMYFVIYEELKSLLRQTQSDSRTNSTFEYTTAAFVAKVIATVSLYPHEVIRTRLRQEVVHSSNDPPRVYTGFIQTIRKVYMDEGWNGLYGGLGARLIRQVPNTVIMFLAFENIVNFLAKEG